MKTIDQIFEQKRLFFYEKCHKFSSCYRFLLSAPMEEKKWNDNRWIPFTSRTELFVQSSTFAKLWNFIVLLFIPLYVSFHLTKYFFD